MATTRSENRRLLLELMPKGAVCAEIGVWDGGFSEEILRITEPKTLHLIDPWLFQPEFSNSAFGREARRDTMDQQYRGVARKFKGDKRVVIHRAMSDAALTTFADGLLDWVYIDGNHNYEVVLNDLQMCLSKVKPDGIISGDDLLWNVNDGAPVRTAVRKVKRRLADQVEFHRFGQQWRMQLMRSQGLAQTGQTRLLKERTKAKRAA